MTSRWAARLDRLDGSVDREFGDRWDVLPMAAAPNAPAAVDVSRPVVMGVLATFTERAHHVSAHGEGLYRMARVDPGFSTQTPLLSITESRLPWPGFLRRLDHVRRVATGDVYEVSDVKPDGDGRLLIELKHLDRIAP